MNYLSTDYSDYLFWICIGYVSGSVMYAYLLPKLIKHIDIRALSDDQNPGAANAFKHAGIPTGILVIVCELLKGILPIWLARRFVSIEHLLFSLVMAAPVLGHAFPLFQKGKQGGKSIAVSFGVLIGLVPDLGPVLMLVMFYLLFSLVIVIRPHLFRSVLTYLCFCLSCLFLKQPPAIVAGCIIISVIVIAKHLKKYHGEKMSVSLLLF